MKTTGAPSRSFRGLLAGVRGAAMTEFAITAMVFIPLTLSAILFNDLLLVRLKLQEVSRYVAWELTDMRLSDYAKDGSQSKHDDLFTTQLNTLMSEVATRYGDDLDGATRNSNLSPQIPTINSRFIGLQLSDLKLADGVDSNVEARMLSFFGGDVTSEGGFMANVESALFGRFELNQKGMAQISVSTLVKPKGYNPRFLERGRLRRGQGILSTSGLTYKSTPIMLLADAWDVKDGRDVEVFPNTSNLQNAPPYAKQVKRTAFFGLNIGGVDQAVTEVAGIFQIDNPISPWRLVSRTYDKSLGTDSGKVTLNTNRDIFDGSKHGSSISRHHTAPLRDTWNYSDSDYCKTFERLSAGYMGCPEGEISNPGASNYPCDYTSGNVCRSGG